MRVATCHPDRPYKAKGMCSSCYSRHLSRLWRQNHPGYDSARKKASGYKATYSSARRFVRKLTAYGITIEEYDQMLSEQDGKCAICGSYMEKPCIDHDHQTNVVRGLLCPKCNIGIGHFADNVNILQSAISYLGECGAIKVILGGVPVMIHKLNPPITINNKAELN